MLHLADTGEVKCLDFGGFAPHDFTIDQWGTPPRYQYRDVGSSVFPGTLAGWTEVLERHGTRSLSQTLEPAIEHARRGVPARPVVVDFIARLESEMPRFPELAGIFLPGGRVPRPGQIVMNRDLADTYEEIAENGTAHFYHHLPTPPPGAKHQRCASPLKLTGSHLPRHRSCTGPTFAGSQMHHDDTEMSALGSVTGPLVSIPILLRQHRPMGCCTYPSIALSTSLHRPIAHRFPFDRTMPRPRRNRSRRYLA